MIKLSQISTREEHIVQSVSRERLGVRLLELGIIPGSTVEVLFTAPGGCPIAVLINGEYILGLRLEEADLVTVYSTKHTTHDNLRN